MKRLGSRWRNPSNNEVPVAIESTPRRPLVLEDGKITIERLGMKPQVVNLQFLSERPDLSRVLANGLAQLYQPPPRVETVTAVRTAIRRFYRFLDWRDSPTDGILLAHNLSLGLFQEFGVWLNQTRGWEQASARGHTSLLCNTIAKIKRYSPTEFPSDLQCPRNLFPGASSTIQGTQPIAIEAYRMILKIAHTNAGQIMQSYQEGDVPQSANEIISFMILIAARTAINASCLYDLRRTCLGPAGLDPELFAIVWFKARAGAWQKYVEEGDRLIAGAVTLIRSLLDFTAPLIGGAAEYDKERVFL